MMDVAFFYFFTYLLYAAPAVVVAHGLKDWLNLRGHELFAFGLLLGFLWPSLTLYPLMVLNVPVGDWAVYGGLLILYALALWVWRRGIEVELSLPLLLMVVLFLTVFAVRIQSASSIYSELDPYYYAYSAWMLAEGGVVPYHDMTAWYPEGGSHRSVPFHTALLYSYYTLMGGGNQYSLSLAAHLYPPVAAALAALFFFLMALRLVKVEDVEGPVRVKGAHLAAVAAFLYALAFSFTPHFLIKTFSGVFEVQPYAFALLSAVFFLTVAESRGLLLALPGLTLGSVSFSIYFLGFLAYVVWKVLLRPQDPFTAFDRVIALSVALSQLLVVLYTLKGLSLLALSLASAAFLYLYPHIYARLRNPWAVRVAVPLLFLLLFLSPVGAAFVDFVKGVATVGSYRTALEWTIAEQNPSPQDLNPFLGVWGLSFPKVLWELLSIPLQLFLILFANAISTLFAVPPFYAPKAAGLYMLVMELFFAVLLYMMFKDPSPKLLVAFAISPTLVVTLFKAKFLIYFAFALYTASLFVFHVLSRWRWGGWLFLIFSLLSVPFFLPTALPYLSLFPLPKVGFHPEVYGNELSLLCQSGLEEACLWPSSPPEWEDYKRFSYPLCVATTAMKWGDVDRVALSRRCSAISMDWMDAMAFISSLPPGARVTSWWDYGHWINFFGQRNAVLRNEHSNLTMIYRIAYAYVMNSSEMPRAMEDYGSRYLLVDREIVFGGAGFGGKFHALNYLACVYANETNVSVGPGESECERANLWETVRLALPLQRCTINPITGQEGYLVERFFPLEERWRPYYCLGQAELANGSRVEALYYLDRKGPAGELRLNKAFLLPVAEKDGVPIVFQTLYTKDRVWVDQGEVVSGWEDRIGKGRFYESVLYQGYVLKDLENFTKLYDNGYVVIYGR